MTWNKTKILSIPKTLKNKITIFSCFVFLFIGYLFCGNNKVIVSRYVISSPKIPKNFNKYKIAHISDFHNCPLGNQIVKKLKKEHPDIIVITGDLIDSTQTDIDVSLCFVKELLPIAPVYYVTGNHEAAISDYPKFEKRLKELGVSVLDERQIDLTKNGESICLTGIGDANMRDRFEPKYKNRIANKLSNLPIHEEKFNILLSHRPEEFGTYSTFGYHLVLTGHAHGGQIRIPFIGGIYAPSQGFFPEYDAGVYTVGDMNMIVSRGIGNSVFPLRVNNFPELVIVHLENQ